MIQKYQVTNHDILNVMLKMININIITKLQITQIYLFNAFTNNTFNAFLSLDNFD